MKKKSPLNHLVSPFSCLVSGDRVTSAKVAALNAKVRERCPNTSSVTVFP